MLQWYQSDGVTLIGNLHFGNVGPGEDYFTKNSGYIETIIKNTGVVTVELIVVEILPISSFELNSYVQIATGATEPDPEDFVGYTDLPLSLGTLGPSATVKVWLNCVVPEFALRASGQYARLRAYGTEA